MALAAVYITGISRIELREPVSPTLPVGGEMLLITSSAEIGILSSVESRQLIRALLPMDGQEARFLLSIGCVGIFACVLEFLQGSAPTAKVLVLETPAARVQLMLDAAKIGAGADGFVAQDVAYIVRLSRQPCYGSLMIHYCAILSREVSLTGTNRLASRLTTCISHVLTHYPETRIVSFENCSAWSRHLKVAVNSSATQGSRIDCQRWLPSVECDHRHFMTARPLMDIEAYGDVLKHSPLLLFCLGAGGRIGLLLVSRGSRAPLPMTMPKGMPYDCPTPPLAQFTTRQSSAPTVLYCQPEYYGRDHFYFRWRLTHDYL